MKNKIGKTSELLLTLVILKETVVVISSDHPFTTWYVRFTMHSTMKNKFKGYHCKSDMPLMNRGTH